MGPGIATNTGDTAWVLSSAALVLFMTPGLALFYGGLVRSKNVLGTMMQAVAAIAIVSVVWLLAGYTFAFGPDVGGVIGGLAHLGFRGVEAAPHALAPTVPHTAFASFQLMFAVITPALIAGAFAERVRFGGYVAFVALWSLFVYSPLAHWVWGGGFLGADGLGALDFAGGTVVHISAGAAALAAALFVGKRRGYPRGNFAPHNVPMVVLGRGHPVVRVVRLQRRERARRQRARVLGVPGDAPRCRRRADRLARARTDPARQGDGGGRCDGRGRRARRDHARRRVRRTRTRAPDRPGRRTGLLRRGRAEVAVRLRRFAGRGGCPHGGWTGGRAPDGRVRIARGQSSGRRRWSGPDRAPGGGRRRGARVLVRRHVG